MALTSDHVNFLVYRYLLEAGFAHTAFTFGAESSILQSGLPGADVPVGSLVSILQKGFQYAELEANLTEHSTDLYADFTPLSARDIMTEDLEGLRALVRDWHERREAAELDALATGPVEIEPEACVALAGPGAAVCACPWAASDTPPRLAAGAADGSLMVWEFGMDGGRVAAAAVPPAAACATGGEVTAVEWDPGSGQLAVALMNGGIQIWGADGTQRCVLKGHDKGVFALRWNGRGDLLLSASVDCSAVVWDVAGAGDRARHAHHAAPVLDCDWRTNAIFATASADRTVAACRVGEPRPIRVWRGHAGDVNGVRWSSGGRVLASASDDGTVRLWSLASDAPLRVLPGHGAEVNCVRWGPVGDDDQLVASAGADGLVQVCDPADGQVVARMDRHGANVPHLRWSPAGPYLASGDELGQVYVWHAQTGKVVRSIQFTALIHDLHWAPDGQTLSVCLGGDSADVRVVPLAPTRGTGGQPPAPMTA